MARTEPANTAALAEKDVAGRVHQFILTKLLEGEDPPNLSETTPLITTGIIDSINVLKVGLFLEKTFNIRISNEELANPRTLETIAAITRLVLSKRPLAAS